VKMRHSAEGRPFWGADASRVMASASRDRELSLRRAMIAGQHLKERSFRRDAETSTRDACAPQAARGERQ
jgi:hypothetical protein